MWKFCPAIAAGNAFILKPSERDPSVPIMLAELMLEAGLPAGILNVVNGDKEAVDTILTDPRVMAIGHMDEIGFMVKEITDEGFVKFLPLGGWWGHVALSQRVMVRTAKGDFVGVIGSKAPHILKPDELRTLLDEGQETGIIDATERVLIDNLLEALRDGVIMVVVMSVIVVVIVVVIMVVVVLIKRQRARGPGSEERPVFRGGQNGIRRSLWVNW